MNQKQVPTKYHMNGPGRGDSRLGTPKKRLALMSGGALRARYGRKAPAPLPEGKRKKARVEEPLTALEKADDVSEWIDRRIKQLMASPYERPEFWAIQTLEPHLIGTDWSVNKWRIVGPGDLNDKVTASIRNAHNSKWVRNISLWKLRPFESMSMAEQAEVESVRAGYRGMEAKHMDPMLAGTSKVQVQVATARARSVKPQATAEKQALSIRWESRKKAKANLQHDEKILHRAGGLDRKRSLAASKTGDGPNFAEVEGRWLRVAGYSDDVAARTPWIVHPPSGGGKAKGAKAASLSRNFSVTRVAKDSTGELWVQGDVVPQMKKDDLVGAAISIDNMAVCQVVKPMAVGVKPTKK